MLTPIKDVEAGQHSLTLLRCSSRRLRTGLCTINSLLDVDDDRMEKLLLATNDKIFLLWICAAPQNLFLSTWSMHDGEKFLAESIFQEDGSGTSFAFVKNSDKSNQFLVSMLEISSPGAASFELSHEEKQSVLNRDQTSQGIRHAKFRFGTRSSLYILLVVVTFFFVVVLGVLYEKGIRESGNIYQKYHIDGSAGPRYQLQFSFQNVTRWWNSNQRSEQEWFLRIDDQAMIPAELVDPEELHYQAWYQKRYPEMDRIRLSKQYLNESFLGDPEQIQIPADRAFHMSHCVRAVRRYWQAKETKRHVCPRDIDYRHIKHCLDALDMWAFPEGPRGSDNTRMEAPAVDNTFLVWKTKVCFDH